MYAGGGECGLDNVRTLCVPCHAAVTAEQASPAREALLVLHGPPHAPRASSASTRSQHRAHALLCVHVRACMLSSARPAATGREQHSESELPVNLSCHPGRLPTAPPSAAQLPPLPPRHPLQEAADQRRGRRLGGAASGRRLRAARAGASRLAAGRHPGPATRASRPPPPPRVRVPLSWPDLRPPPSQG